ncbi:sulfotransferase family protein [Saccharothrix sp. Mg75]|uniref:sulfotransferase family protein n=1 Tax=Saccharothrix sp. Mg75 TaxID=3445357 RepID=UPI003EF084C2
MEPEKSLAEAPRRIIFIGGVHGRTGTSVVKRLLCGHPDVSAVAGGETRMLEAICELWPTLAINVAYTPSAAMSGLAAFTAHVHNMLGDTPELRGAIDRLADQLGVRYLRLPGRQRLPMPAPQDEGSLTEALGAFIVEAFSAAALDPTRPVLCEKTPSNALYLRRLCRLLPGARIVVMVRAPLAVALSHTQRDWGPPDPAEAVAYTAAYFKRWRLMDVQEERCLLVRQEDLVIDPDRTFSLMLDHLRLRKDDELLRHARSQLRPSVDRRSRFAISELAVLKARLGDELDAFGYES